MERQEVEHVWRGRLAEAALQLKLARNLLKEVRLSGDSPDYDRAMQAESAAHAEYLRVLHLYEVLVQELPDERRTAAGAA